MDNVIFTVRGNVPIAREVYHLTLAGDTSAITAPGQFVNIRLSGFFLRRPISVCDYAPGSLTLIYKVVGEGTRALSRYGVGTQLEVLTGLGNGYDTAPAGRAPLLIGGGVGVPPLYHLCKKLVGEGRRPTVILGFNTAADVFYEQEFQALGVEVRLTTVDGSRGRKGFVTDAMEDVDYTYFYCCGPEPMLRAVHRASVTSGQLSFEARMGCGFGACMGCSCRTLTGDKRICKEGPVLEKEEIAW